MIKKMTKAQEKKIPLYYNKWLQSGLRTETIDKEKSKRAVEWIYKELLDKPIPKIIYAESPMQATLMGYCIHSIPEMLPNIKMEGSQLESQLRSQLGSQLGSQLENQLWSQLGSQLGSQLESQLRSQLWSQLESQLRSQLESQLGSQLENQLWSQLGSQLWSQLGSQLESQLESQLWSQLGSQLESQLRSQLWSQLGSQLGSNKNSEWIRNHWGDYYNCNMWIGWIGFYDFILCELMKEKKKDFTKFTTFISHWKNLHMIYPYDGLCLVVDFPESIQKNPDGRLHRDMAPAIRYRDTYSLYALNGIIMPEKIVMTSVDKLNPKEILKEQNADVRREGLRKIGVERLVSELSTKTLDKKDGYELLLLDIGDNRKRPYLKMFNPSEKVWHIEGILPEIDTVEKALCYRNGLQTWKEPLVLT